MSQLGYMAMAVGVGSVTGGMFHLFTHAFFKACLFLGAGSVIHAVHSQFMGDMGGLKKKMPVTYWTFLISTLAIAGVPAVLGLPLEGDGAHERARVREPPRGLVRPQAAVPLRGHRPRS